MTDLRNRRLQQHIVRWALAFCALIPTASLAQWAGPERINAENISVMIDVNYANVPTEWGTGIIVARRQNTLYIATAKHVLNRGKIHDVQVSFRWNNHSLGNDFGTPVTARASLAAPLPPSPLDLAALKVELDETKAPSADDLLFAVLADPAEIKANLSVRPLGHANGKYWITCESPGRVNDASDDSIVFASDCADDGHSGGPVFDDYWHLVGMELKRGNDSASAAAMGTILATLKLWNIPVDLAAAKAPKRNQFLAASVGQRSACGITLTNDVFCWGSNRDGRLGMGRPDEGFNADIAFPIADPHSFTTVSVGATAACGVTTGKAIRCWGSNESGQLGDGTTQSSTRPVPVRSDLSFVSVSSGRIHSCGLTLDGTAYCWGGNGQGQLGIGTTSDALVPTRVSSPNHWLEVSAGPDTTCAITNTHETYCWGGNGDAVLNRSAAMPITIPTKVPLPFQLSHISVGGLAGMGYDRLYVTSLLCGITDEGKAYCWGSEFNETQFTKDDSRPSTFEDTSIVTTAPVALPVNGVSSISVGHEDLCAINATPKTLYCWGRDKFAAQQKFTIAAGELKAGRGIDLKVEPVSVATGSVTACVLASDRNLYCWGDDYDDKILGNGVKGVLETPTLSVVSSNCSTPGPAPVDHDVVIGSMLSFGGIHQVADAIHAIPSEQLQSEPFEKLFARMDLLRQRIQGRIRACQLSEDAPPVQNILSLRKLEEEMHSAWYDMAMILPTTPAKEAEQTTAKAKAQLEKLVQQYRIAAAAPALKEDVLP